MNLFVGVVTHRVARWPQLFSLLRAQSQTALPVRLLFVDGGTNELAPHLLGSGLRNWSLLPTPPTRTIASYRETIRREVRGKPGYLVFVDDDDYFAPHHFDTLVRRALAHEEAWCVGVRDVVTLAPDGRVAHVQARAQWPVFQSSCFSTSALDVPFRDARAEDTVWISSLLAGHGPAQIVTNDAQTYLHTVHDTNTANRLVVPPDAPRWADVDRVGDVRLPPFDPHYAIV